MVHRINWYMGKKDRKPKLPITFKILQSLISLHPTPTGIGILNYTTAIHLTVPTFLRCSEFTVCKSHNFNPAAHLTHSSVRFKPSFAAPNHIVLSMPSSQTPSGRAHPSLFLQLLVPQLALSWAFNDSTHLTPDHWNLPYLLVMTACRVVITTKHLNSTPKTTQNNQNLIKII